MRKAILYIGWALMAMPSCSDRIDEPAQGGNIQLRASVGDIQVSNRAVAAPYLGGMISAGQPLEAAVWFRRETGVYEDPQPASTLPPAHTTVTFKGSQLEYVYNGNEENLQYPTDKSNICCVGLYPKSGWTLSEDNMTVSHVIDGVDDLMFAEEKIGSWNVNFEPMRFEHLLTWIKINVCASSHDAVDAWGEIQQIEISSASEVKIDLKSGTCEYVSTDAESTPYISAMYEKDSLITLSTAMQEVGSVLCSPRTQYTLWVKTKNKSGEEERRKVELNLNLMDEKNETFTNLEDASQARGKCFVLSLYFTPHKVIEGVCSLNAWNNQNEDIYLQ